MREAQCLCETPFPLFRKIELCWVFYYIIGSVPARRAVWKITLSSFPFLGQTHLVVVFPIKRRTGHPGSWNHLYLLFHLKHHSRWLEKRRKGGAYYSQPDLEPSSRSCRKSLTFGWGSCIPVHGSSLSNTYIPNVWLLFLGGLPINKERRIPFPWSRQWFGLVLYACFAAAQAASSWCWSYNWSCGKIFFKFDNIVGFDKMNY